MGILSLLGLGNSKIKEALQRGAVIIDVRTANEFDLGHAPEALNIPVDRIPINTKRIKDMSRPVVLCCKSGARSNQALQLLKAKGVKEVYNGGSWENVAKVLLKL